MKISRRELGSKLNDKLEKNLSIKEISNWAYDLFINLRNDDMIIDDILNRLSLMEAGPEFEFTEKELKIIAEGLINNADSPFQVVDNLRRLKS